MNEHLHKESVLKTWFVIFALLALILGKGFFSFFVVSDLGQPTWDYRPILDVPAESPYAVYQKGPHPQHVLGAGGE
ncbi:MAG: hypothetical protein JJV98_01230 [Desulfosarcina sp.]|nr:hypothetical protein [Desulfobacterales bacterium]